MIDLTEETKYVKVQEEPASRVAADRALQLAAVLAITGFIEGFVLGAQAHGYTDWRPVLYGALIAAAQGSLAFLKRWLHEGMILDEPETVTAQPYATVKEVEQYVERAADKPTLSSLP